MKRILPQYFRHKRVAQRKHFPFHAFQNGNHNYCSQGFFGAQWDSCYGLVVWDKGWHSHNNLDISVHADSLWLYHPYRVEHIHNKSGESANLMPWKQNVKHFLIVKTKYESRVTFLYPKLGFKRKLEHFIVFKMFPRLQLSKINSVNL